MKIVGYVVLAAVAILGISWVATDNYFFLYKYFAPKQEAVRRQVFEQSKAYNQGMIQELQNMQFEYLKTDKAHQAALASIILHRAADYDVDKLPADLRHFIQSLKEKKEVEQ
jgi:hypothetical protein